MLSLKFFLISIVIKNLACIFQCVKFIVIVYIWGKCSQLRDGHMRCLLYLDQMSYSLQQ